MTTAGKIRVLVIDDSLFLRRNLPRILESDPQIEVVGVAENGAEGVRQVEALRPDVVVLDLVMPVMDGLTALRRIMRETPTPVIVVSAAAREGAQETLEALALGAVDFVAKPSGPVSLDIHKIRNELVQKVRAAYASARDTSVSITRDRFQAVIQGLASLEKSVESATSCERGQAGGKRLVAIAASTGGPVALQHVLIGLPADLNAGLVVVLHIAVGFTRPLAERLNELSPITVREAEDGAPITPGVALIAPTGVHLTVARRNAGLVARLNSEPVNAIHLPSADVLFDSIAQCCAAEACGVILTGMGNDGALGLCAVRRNGGYTIAQDEATSVVYGMPRRAVELGGVDISLPLDQIAAEIVRVTADVERR